MKILKNLIFVGLIIIVYNCETRTYEDISEKETVIQKVDYTTYIKPMMESNCTSCHSTTGSASYYPLTTFTTVKNAVDGIINRIEKPNGDPQKMPQGGSLSQANINIIKQWKTDGLVE